MQNISGTGSLYMGGAFLHRFRDGPIYISDPTWSNHRSVMENAGLTVKTYPYYNSKEKKFDFDGMMQCLKVRDLP